MNGRALWALLLALCLPSVVFGDGTIPPPTVQKMNDQVYALLGPIGFPGKDNHGYMVNSTAIIGDRGVILVDTGFTHKIGRHLKSAIARITDKPVTHIINTHHHGDHTLGNSAFPDAEIISSKKCRDLLKETAYDWIGVVENMTGEKFPNTRPVLASRVYPENSRTDIMLQGVKLRLWVPHGSHTPGDMMVYLPTYKILISGDILVKKMMPSFRDAHVKTWIDTLKQIQALDIDAIIPGHGPLMTMADVKDMHRRMAALYAAVEAGYKKGLMDSEIRKTLDLSEWKKMAEFDGLMGTNISRTYLEVEQANF